MQEKASTCQAAYVFERAKPIEQNMLNSENLTFPVEQMVNDTKDCCNGVFYILLNFT